LTVAYDNQESANIATALAALSEEMSIAAVSCGHLDDALGQILEATPPEHRMAVMQELHMVDMLAQHITAITDFTARLAEAAAAGVHFDVDRALGAITLGTVADRMRDAIVQKAA
jgi:hypothetical protein